MKGSNGNVFAVNDVTAKADPFKLKFALSPIRAHVLKTQEAPAKVRNEKKHRKCLLKQYR